MICPYCKGDKYNVYRFIQKDNKNFRYIECKSCKRTYKSVEYIPNNWDYERLYKGLMKDFKSIMFKYKNTYEKDGEW